MYSINDLTSINETIMPLKVLADKERKAIYGLSGELYTPHIDTYMASCVKRAIILRDLKRSKLIPFTDVEIITDKLMVLFKKAKINEVVEHLGENYECRFLPIKLSKSGNIVRKWAKYWLRKKADGSIDAEWETQVREIWPEYFVVKFKN